MKVPWLHVLLGWLGAAALVVYLGATTDLAAFARTVVSADLGTFLLATLVAGPVAFALDATGVRVLLRGAGMALPFGEAARLRGASFLLNIVNYHLALAAIAAILARRTGRGGAEAAGFAMTLGLLDLWALSGLALAGLLTGEAGLPAGARAALIAVAAAGVVAGPVGWIAARRLRRAVRRGGVVAGVLAALAGLPPGTAVAAALLRGALVFTFIASDWGFLRAFGFAVPPGAAMVGLPAVYLGSALPVSVGGLGGGQVVMRWVFAGWAPAGVTDVAAVDAVSTCAFLTVLLLRGGIGMACLPWALRAIRGAGADAPARGPVA